MVGTGYHLILYNYVTMIPVILLESTLTLYRVKANLMNICHKNVGKLPIDRLEEELITVLTVIACRPKANTDSDPYNKQSRSKAFWSAGSGTTRGCKQQGRLTDVC